MGKKKKKKERKKRKKTPARLEKKKFPSPPKNDYNFTRMEDVLIERFSAASLDEDILGEILNEKQEVIVRTLTEGWECPWSPKSTIEKIHKFLDFLDLECSRNYTQLCKYNVTKNRSSRVNSIFLFFNVKIHTLILLARFEDQKKLDLKALAKDGILMYENVVKMSQTELFEALQCIGSKWSELHPSDTLWEYLFALQKRAAVLCSMRGGPKTFDGKEVWKNECSEEYLASTQEYISGKNFFLPLKKKILFS